MVFIENITEVIDTVKEMKCSYFICVNFDVEKKKKSDRTVWNK